MTGLRTFEARAMASPLRLTLGPEVEPTLAERCWAEVRDEFERSEQAMSRFRESSGLTILNRAGAIGRSVAVDRRLRRALVTADRARRMTGGSFDPRVLRDLDRLGYVGAAIPAEATSAGTSSPEAGPAVGIGGASLVRSSAPAHRSVEWCADGTIRVTVPIDLGGVGKGLALRWAGHRVAMLLPPTAAALVEAGGDLVSLGAILEAPWRIGLEDPRGGTEPLAVLEVTMGAVATSSILVNRWIGPTGEAVHHLLDPRTGEPAPAGLAAVTVAGPDPAWSEVRTKQLFLAGPRAIGPLARGLGLAAWWVTTDGLVEMTPAARQRTVWLRDEGMLRA